MRPYVQKLKEEKEGGEKKEGKGEGRRGEGHRKIHQVSSILIVYGHPTEDIGSGCQPEKRGTVVLRLTGAEREVQFFYQNTAGSPLTRKCIPQECMFAAAG